jgi:hypothetical protein
MAFGFVSAADTVIVRLVNFSASSIPASSGTYRVAVAKL